MPLAQVAFFSRTLGQHVNMNVLLPSLDSPHPAPWPVLYLLHGLSDDHSTWLRRTRLEVYAESGPFLIAMPNGARGFYTDNHEGPAYARYLMEDVVGEVERQYRVRTDRGGRFIAGLSMGGYGAMRLALAHPDRFAGAASHSGALLHGTERDRNRSGALAPDEADRIFGYDPRGSDHDLLTLAHRLSITDTASRPALRIDCGTDDYLIDDNRQFVARLRELGIDHEYEEHPGAHTWDYWDAHIRDTLRFFRQTLRS